MGTNISFQKRHVTLQFRYTDKFFTSTCEDIESFCSTDIYNKAIVICSTAATSSKIQLRIDQYLDKTEDLLGDTVLVISMQKK